MKPVGTRLPRGKLGDNADDSSVAFAASSSDMAALKLQARGLSRVLAALYVGISPTKFDEMVGDGRMPKPKRIDARRVWDRRRLDEAFEALPDETSKRGDGWEHLNASRR